MTSITPPAWRVSKPAASPLPTAPVVQKRSRSIWPGLLIIVGVPTLLFAAEATFGLITV